MQVHAFSPNARLAWSECASIPVWMVGAKTAVINGMVYVGGTVTAEDDSHMNLVCKYDPVKDEWTTLPPAPVRGFGVGQLNGKLMIVGGETEREGVTRDVHVLEEETQQWVKSIPPMPRGLVFSIVVSHSSSLVVCGTPDMTSSALVLVYNSQSSQWHSAAAMPLTFQSVYSSAVIVNDTYYMAVGGKGIADQVKQRSWPTSPAVFSIPLSDLLDPNAPEPCFCQCMPDTPCRGSRLAATGGCLLALGGLMPSYKNILTDIWLALSRTSKTPNLSTAVHAYCSATSSWVEIGDLPDLQGFIPAVTTLSSGELFIAGGLFNEKQVFRCIIK